MGISFGPHSRIQERGGRYEEQGNKSEVREEIGTKNKTAGSRNEAEQKEFRGQEPKSGGKNLVGGYKPDIFDLREMSNVFSVKREVIGDADGSDKNIMGPNQFTSRF